MKYAWLKDNTDAKFAIKAMKKKEIIDSKHVDHIENEKKILEVIEHPFIVSAFVICSNQINDCFFDIFSWTTLDSCRTRCTSILSLSYLREATSSLITVVSATSMQNKHSFMEDKSSPFSSICRAKKLCIGISNPRI